MELDHLYFGFNSEKFLEVCQKYPDSRFATHKVVKTTDDSWEGLYIQCRNKTYFEYLNERRTNKMGIAFRTNTPMESGAPVEVRQQSHLDWKWGTRRFPDGRFWFNWFSLNDYREMETPFNFWIMQYDTAWLNRREITPAINSPLFGIEKMKLEANYKLKVLFLQSSRFFDKSIEDNNQRSLIRISDTEICINWFDYHDSKQIELLDLEFKK